MTEHKSECCLLAHVYPSSIQLQRYIVHLFKYKMSRFDKQKSGPLFRIRGPKKVENWRLHARFDHEQITSKVLPLIFALDVLFIWGNTEYHPNGSLHVSAFILTMSAPQKWNGFTVSFQGTRLLCIASLCPLKCHFNFQSDAFAACLIVRTGDEVCSDFSACKIKWGPWLILADTGAN